MNTRFIKTRFKVGVLLFVTTSLVAVSLQPASSSSQLLFDHFDGATLDTSRWTVLDGGGGMSVSGSLFQTAGGPDHKRINSIDTFALSGQSLRARARIRLAGDYQKFGFQVNAVEFPGPTMGYYFDTYDNQFGNNEHTIRVIVASVSPSNSYAEIVNTQAPVTWYEFHDFSVVRTGVDVIFSIDNQEVARIADTFAGALPVGVWNDRPPLMQTDWVEVDQFSPGCTEAPANLVSWWPGDGNANDIADGNNGTLINGAAFAPGMVGPAFSLDGTDDAVEVPDAPNLNPTQQITLDAWVYPTATSGDPDVVNMIVNKEEFFPTGTIAQYELGRQNTGNCSPDAGIPAGNLVFFMEGLSGLPTECRGWIDGGAFLPLNAWSHVALTFDGAAVRTYVNGTLSRELPASGTLAATNGKFRIGARNQTSGEPVQSSRWAGRIDEVEIYDRALAASEIQSIFDAGSSGKCKNVIVPQLTALGAARAWLGLKNSDDVGTKFDLLTEVFKNGSPIGSGQLNAVPGGSSGFNNAVLRTIDLALSAPTGVQSGDTLSIRLSVRIAVGVTGHRSGTARLWFNDPAADSRFDATIGGATNDYFLLNGFALGAAAGAGPKKTIDVFVDRALGGNPFKPFGTWSRTF